VASASIINHPKEALLAPESPTFDPTPSFGPSFHYIRGPALMVYPQTTENRYPGVAPFLILCVGFAVVAAHWLPRLQHVLLLVRLLD
jgi:hypothetical protein